MAKKVCLECKDRIATYQSFCEECFRKLLKNKLEEDK
jgi:predicted amidophosphoribosyltransferase